MERARGEERASALDPRCPLIHPSHPDLPPHSATAADDEDPDQRPPLAPDLADRSLTSWAGAAEAEAAARRARRAEEEAEEARMRGEGGVAGRPRPPPVEVEMEAVVGRADGAETLTTTPVPPSSDPSPSSPLFTTAAADLDRHFASVQDICDGVTLPSAARDLGAALVGVADVAGLTERLKGGSRDGGGSGDGFQPPLSPEAKLAAWADLRDAAFTAAVGGPWLVAALALALRVQLNVLGRHLFLAAHVEDGGGGSGLSPSSVPPSKVSTAAQARLLEYGHHFVREGAAGLLQSAVKPAAITAATAGGLDLGAPVSADALLDRLSAAHAAVDGGVAGWKRGGIDDADTTVGWPALLLPAPAAAEAALAAGEEAAVAASGASPAVLASDAAMVRGMAAELALIYASPRFAAAVRAGAAAVAGQAAAALGAAVSAAGPSLPLAKAVPRAAAVGRALVDPTSPAFAEAVRVVGGLPEVRELCAAVYSCGPPL